MTEKSAWTDADEQELLAAKTEADAQRGNYKQSLDRTRALTAKRAASGGRTAKQLATEAIEDLRASYDLVYVAQDDRLTDKQVDALVSGGNYFDVDGLDDFTGEQSDANAAGILEEVVDDVIERWEREDGDDYGFIKAAFDGSEHEDHVREAIYDRDSSNPVRDLARQTPDVLLRITCIDEDHAYSFRPDTAEQILRDVGLEPDEHNVATVQYALNNVSPEYTVVLGQWIVGADVEQLLDLRAGEEDLVEIENPYLYLGNVFTGSGFITEEPLRGTVRVRRGDLHTDKQSFGYPVNEVYGGLSASQFRAEIRAVEPVSADAADAAPAQE